MATPTHQPTTEQAAVLNSTAPLKLTIANAGSGKTTLMAMVYARLFLEEEAKYRQNHPDAPTNPQGHLIDEKDITALTRHFEAITFTRKAAAELDARIRKFLHQQSINLPRTRKTGGRESRWILARTIDSKTQQTFFHPLFLKWFVTNNPRWSNRLTTMTEAALASRGGSLWLEETAASDPYSTSIGWQASQVLRAWGPQLMDQDQTAVTELVILEELGWLTGVLSTLKDRAQQRLTTATQAEWSNTTTALKEPLLKDIIKQVHSKNREKVKTLTATLQMDLFSDQKSDTEIDYRKFWDQLADKERELPEDRKLIAVEQRKNFEKKERMVKEFTTAYELARRRGYHPGATTQEPEVIAAIASISESHLGPITLTDFDRWWQQLEQAKQDLGVLDFTDFMGAIIEGLGANPYLLEVGQSHPRLGFRKRHIILDEAQDNDPAQWQLAELWQKAMGTGCTMNIVGDPGQSIYAYRGAQPEGMEALLKGDEGDTYQRYHLSHCFRSAPPLVELGNEIITTLSDYRDIKQPSLAAHAKLAGKIEIWAPQTDIDEAAKVAGAARAWLREGHTVMVLFRSNGHRTATFRRLQEDGLLEDNKVQFISTHQAKGLEADHVILLGCSAGHWPDPRGDLQQEVNLFYVACTRPRTHLVISARLHETERNRDGEIEDKLVGPSPFLSWIPSLQALWITQHHDPETLITGLETHDAATVQITNTRRLRIAALTTGYHPNQKHKAIFIGGLADEKANQAWIEQQIAKGQAPQPEQGDTTAAINQELGEPIDQPLDPAQADNQFKKLERAHLQLLLRLELTRNRVTGLLPKINQDEWQTGWKLGWWCKKSTGRWVFTHTYLGLEAAAARNRKAKRSQSQST